MESLMNKITILSAALVFGGLAACQESPREERAENIQENADNAADAFEEAADNTTNPVAENALRNQAEGIRAGGENIADDMRDTGAATDNRTP
jgi:uncharacterized lipoprotein